MRKIFISVLTLLAFASVAQAVTSGAEAHRFKYSAQGVSSTGFVEIVASTPKGLNGYSVVNTGPNPIEVAFGPAGSEVVQSVHIGTASVAGIMLPVSAGYATRVSVITLDASNSSAGELEMNLIYN